MREEQRWLREERRWEAEREALLVQIRELELRVKEVESSRDSLLPEATSVTETVANIAKLLQVRYMDDGSISVWEEQIVD